MNILLLESDIVHQKNIKNSLVSLGFADITCLSSLQEARQLLLAQKPSIVITGIILKDGITTELAEEIANLTIPTIFIATPNDIEFYHNLKNNYRFGFLTKPVQPVSLLATINLLMACSNKLSAHEGSQALIVSIGKKRIKLCPQDILWLESEGNYTTICLDANRKYTIKKSLRQTSLQLDSRFIKCHQRYYINQQKIDSIVGDDVVIGDHKIPIGVTYKVAFLERFNRAV